MEPKSKQELLEYLIRNDGSVICKICGEILASRTHWYRHKYKLHVANSVSHQPLYHCDQCNLYFKSRKGFIGHKHRHDVPVITIKQEPVDEDLFVPKTEVYRDQKYGAFNEKNWENRREKEEKLVADIISRVRQECESSGTRRGYSRRSTVINNA